MLEKQGRDDLVRERFGLAEDVDLGGEEVDLGREMWEAGRERRGLPLDEVNTWETSVRAVAGTPIIRKGKTRASDGVSPSLVQALRKTTASKYDPFAGAAHIFLSSNVDVSSTLKAKGRIKDPGVLERLSGRVKSETKAVGLSAGLLAGYGSE